MEFGHAAWAPSAFVRNIPPTCGITPVDLPNFRHQSRGSDLFTRESTRDPVTQWHPNCSGSLGSGGALGFADPSTVVGYAYVTSQMGTTLTGDPRDVALREALYAALSASSGAPPMAA